MRPEDWKPIDERTPRGEPVLLCAGPPEALGPGHLYWKYGVGMFSEAFGLGDWPWGFKPTHWQPLVPPEEPLK